ncbi:MAG: YeeE/YedE family protein [Gammaproteobacteria bacterium]|nr:YeeE/YedE family protein [Gammaproteobacteria bacterium]
MIDKSVHGLWLAVAATVVLTLILHLQRSGGTLAVLFVIGIALGATLYHAALGFTAAYRRFFLDGEISGIVAQIVMLAVAMTLFAPVLAAGEVFGHGVSGAVAPVGVSMVLGAFLFGIGMQLGGGCGSGTLFTMGGGDARMVVTLACFCIGGFWGSLDLAWWRTLPEAPAAALGERWGYGRALAAQLVVLGLVYVVLRRRFGRPVPSRPPPGGPERPSLLYGPWPLLLGAVLLAVLNWLTLLVAGHPWSITWGMTLWGAKAAVLVGWEPVGQGFWSGLFQQQALANPVLDDPTSVMDVGIIAGAFVAAVLAGRFRPTLHIPPRALLASVVGGFLLGYGARLAYGCNIGAFFSGVASTSLHGWLWIAAALPGNWLGIKLRPWFGLPR